MRRGEGELRLERAQPADAAAATTGDSVAGSGVWNFAAAAIPQVYLAVVSIAAARFLGVEAFGRQSFIAFVAISVMMLLTLGVPPALSRFVGEALGRGQPEVVGELVGLAARLLVPAAAVGAAGLALAGAAGATPRGAWIFAGVGAGASILRQVPSSLLGGVQQWREISAVGLAVGAVATAGTVAVLAAGAGITGMFGVEAAGEVLILLGALVLGLRALRAVRSRATAAASASPAAVAQMLRYVAYSSVTVVLTLVVWRRSEFLFLAHYSGNREIALYSVAFSTVTVLFMLPASMTSVVVPAIATLHGGGAGERIRRGYARALRLLVVASLPLAAATLALGPTLVDLVYGRSFHAVGPVLVLLAIPFPVVAAGALATGLLLAVGGIRRVTVVGVAAAALNIGLDFVLIPRYDAIGAAAANAVAQTASAVPTLILASAAVGGARLHVGSILKAAVAAALGGLVAWACTRLLGGVPGFAVGATAGGALFLGVARLIRILSGDDAAWVHENIGHRLGGAAGWIARVWGPEAAELDSR